MLFELTGRFRMATQAWKARATQRALGSHAQALLVKAKTGLFAVAVQDQGVGRQLRRQGDYGREELARLAPHLAASSKVLVVGAHIGTLAIPLALQGHSVVAIEANPDTFALLQLNVLLNKAHTCVPIQTAASDSAGSISFLLNRANSGGSKRLPMVADPRYYYDQPQEIKVPAQRLDDLLVEQSFDAIVMDIEGSEPFALRGMPRLLSQCRLLQIEFVPHHLSQVAGVDVRSWLEPLLPHFQHLDIPSLRQTVERHSFYASLQALFEAGQGDEGLIFHAGSAQPLA